MPNEWISFKEHTPRAGDIVEVSNYKNRPNYVAKMCWMPSPRFQYKYWREIDWEEKYLKLLSRHEALRGEIRKILDK